MHLQSFGALHSKFLCNVPLVTNRDWVTEEWRKLHNEELNDLYYSLNIIRVVRSRRMRWVGHVACMGERRGIHRVWLGNLRERDHLGDQM